MTRATSPRSSASSDVRSLRAERGMSFGELARLASVNPTELRKIERGLGPPSNGVAERLGIALGTSAAAIVRAHKSLARVATPGEGYVTARPERSFVREPRSKLRPGAIPILDLFCGVGGFSSGFEQTGAFGVVAGIDLLPDRVQTFHENHPTARTVCGDIRELSIDSLLSDCPSPEVIIGGPPCQGFSSLRPFRTLTEDDPRNSLFEHFAMAVAAVRPAWFVLENVVGILTNQQGQALDSLLREFGRIGYSLSWRVINGAFYGLPQRRERFVLVGNRDGRTFSWPEPTHALGGAKSMAGRHGQHHEVASLWGRSDLLPANTVMDAIHDLPPLAAGESANRYDDGVKPTEYERAMRGHSSVLTMHDATAHSEKMLGIIRQSGFNRDALPEGLVKSGFSTCYSRLEPHLPAVTITVNFVHPASNKCIHPLQDRALTPREGARLQGFPDNFRFIGSRTQVVKQIGNAVPPLIGRVIAASLSRQIV